MRQIINATNALELNAGHILKATAPNEDDVVLLEIVTDSGNISDHLFAGWEPHENAFSIGGVWLTRLLDKDLQDDSFRHRLSIERLARGPNLVVRTGSVHLIYCCHVASRYRRQSCGRQQDWDMNLLRTRLTDSNSKFNRSPFNHLATRRNNDRIWQFLKLKGILFFVLLCIFCEKQLKPIWWSQRKI